MVGTRKSSLIDIASAENDKRNSMEQNKSDVINNEREAKDNFTKKVGVIILSTILIVLGIGSIFYFYGKSSLDIAGSRSKLSSIIFADDNLEFNITNLSRRQIINELASIKELTQLSIGHIKNIFITESFLDEQGIEKKALVSATDFLNAINARVPTSFLRSIQPNFMVGVHVFDGNQPFIVLKTSFYENAFVGMLEWEKYIKEDLSPLFAEKNIRTTLTQIATTTSEIKTFMFNDLVLKNKDTRILKNKEGEITLVYSFVDKNTIIITTNENTFGEILTRRGSSRIVQ